MNPLKFVKTNLRSFWKKATSDPLYAAGALGLGASLYGAAGSTFFPDTFKKQMNFLDMGPTTGLGPVTSQSYQTGLGFNNAGQSYSGAPGYSGAQRLTRNTITKPATFLGKSQGFLYDIRKGIGQTVSAPMKFGAMFGSSGSVYDYVTGNGNWGDVKNSIQGIVPDYLNKEGTVSDTWSAYKAAYLSPGGGGGGGAGAGRGTGPQTKAGSRRFIDPAREAQFKSGQTGMYKTNGISARLLSQVIPINDRVSWVDEQARSQRAMSPNIGLSTNIKVGGRYTRTRT